MAKRLFFVSAAILMLMIAYHLGARNAQAQASGPINGFTADGARTWVITANGDVFSREVGGLTFDGHPLIYVGNFWSGGTVTVQPESWGSVKQKFR